MNFFNWNKSNAGSTEYDKPLITIIAILFVLSSGQSEDKSQSTIQRDTQTDRFNASR